jgi:AcrR family transcriptional regulator
MNAIDSPTKRKNKLKITNTAKDLFIKNGIANTTIIDIAAAAKVERKTIYNYFSSKELIAQYIFKEIITFFTGVTQDKSHYEKYETGYEKIKIIYKEFVDFFFNHKEDIIYLIHYDYYFRESAESKIVSEILAASSDAVLAESWNQGILDNSIDIHNMDSNEVFNTIMQSLLGYVSRMFLRGHIIQEETGIGADSTYVFLEILLNGIKKH